VVAQAARIGLVSGATAVQNAHKNKEIMSRVTEMLVIIKVLVHLTPKDPKLVGHAPEGCMTSLVM
jgi:hypothetical protein